MKNQEQIVRFSANMVTIVIFVVSETKSWLLSLAFGELSLLASSFFVGRPGLSRDGLLVVLLAE